jgi:hypothetical protein
MQEASNTSTISVVRSLPNVTFPFIEEHSHEKGPVVLPNTIGTGISIDLGSPNLGTSWHVNAISFFYEKLTYQFFNSTIPPNPLAFYIVFGIFVGSQEVFRESSNKISELPPGLLKPETGPLNTTSVTGLQNLPQPLIVPGGQSLSAQIIVVLTPSETLNKMGGNLENGRMNMAYDLLDYHKKK